jgi:hypothetical protein
MNSTTSASRSLYAPMAAETDLTWITGKIEHRVLFGRTIAEFATDEHHKIVSFPLGDVFAVMRWASTGFGQTATRLEILRAPKTGQGGTQVPFVRPAVEILLRVSGWNNVQRTVKLIDAITMSGIDPIEVAPDYWLHVGNRLATGQAPRSYTRARHLVWQLRRRIAP